MRKNKAVLMLLMLSSVSWASHPQFEISIDNQSATDCTLKKQWLLRGHVSDHTTVPQMIGAGKTMSFMMRNNNGRYVGEDPREILLTYDCGTDKEVTLFSAGQGEHKIFDVKNIDVESKTSGPDKTVMAPSYLHWTLKDGK